MASTKVEAKRFSGKAEQWPHWDQSLQAYLAVNDLIEYSQCKVTFHTITHVRASKTSIFL